MVFLDRVRVGVVVGRMGRVRSQYSNAREVLAHTMLTSVWKLVAVTGLETLDPRF